MDFFLDLWGSEFRILYLDTCCVLSFFYFSWSSQYWIEQDVKDFVSCIPCLQAGLGIVQCCNIFPSLVSSIAKMTIRPLFFPAVLIIIAERGGGPPLPTGRASIPDKNLCYHRCLAPLIS